MDDTETAYPRVLVPTNYRKMAKYVRMVVEEKKDVRAQIKGDRHFRTGQTFVGRVLANLPVINAVYARSGLATKESWLDEWMARSLISELLFGGGRLVSEAKVVRCIRQYENELRSALAEIEAEASTVEQLREPRFVRLNTNELNIEGAKRLLQEEGWFLVEEEFTDYQAFLRRLRNLGDSEYMIDFHFPDMLVFPHSSKQYWGKADHLRAQFQLQNKACLLATYLLKPRRKSVVLDMCSAPGNKATHIANLMKNKGRIYAVERDAHRYAVLCQTARPYGVIHTIHSDCLDLTDQQMSGVEYILLDPSCSGSGMLSRRHIVEPVDPDRLYRLSGLQYKLLSHAMNAFPQAKRIVYATCSVHEQENESVVLGVLRHNGHFRLLDARQELGKEWLNVGSPKYEGVGERCLYARPEVDLTIGMFVAVFERCPEGVENEIYLAYEKQKQSYERVERSLRDTNVGQKKRKFNKKHCAEADVNGKNDEQAGVNGRDSMIESTAEAGSESQVDSVVQDQGKRKSKKKSHEYTVVNGKDTEHKFVREADENQCNGSMQLNPDTLFEPAAVDQKERKSKKKRVDEIKKDVDVEIGNPVEGKEKKKSKKSKKRDVEAETGTESQHDLESEENNNRKSKKKHREDKDSNGKDTEIKSVEEVDHKHSLTEVQTESGKNKERKSKKKKRLNEDEKDEVVENEEIVVVSEDKKSKKSKKRALELAPEPEIESQPDNVPPEQKKLKSKKKNHADDGDANDEAGTEVTKKKQKKKHMVV